MSAPRIYRIATRGSALALAQASWTLQQCGAAFPEASFELNIIKTTGDKLQTASLASPNQELPKGLFTKELEAALLSGEADLAVHSLKDLPTELPEGLKLGAVSAREDARDVLIYRSSPGSATGTLDVLPRSATVATSSTRRQAQILALRPDIKAIPIRGNVGTRLSKLSQKAELDGIVLAAAGLNRLGFQISCDGTLRGKDVPPGLAARPFSFDEMLPCVGQAALGFEIRASDPILERICAKLDDPAAHACVQAERAFLRAMGGGCLSPVAALGQVEGEKLRLRAVSFRTAAALRCDLSGEIRSAEAMGQEAARRLR